LINTHGFQDRNEAATSLMFSPEDTHLGATTAHFRGLPSGHGNIWLWDLSDSAFVPKHLSLVANSPTIQGFLNNNQTIVTLTKEGIASAFHTVPDSHAFHFVSDRESFTPKFLGFSHDLSHGIARMSLVKNILIDSTFAIASIDWSSNLAGMVIAVSIGHYAKDQLPVPRTSFALSAPKVALFHHLESILVSWDLQNRKRLATSPNHELLKVISLSPDGKWLVGGHRDGSIVIWDAETLLEAARFETTKASPIEKIHFSGQGRYFATHSEDSILRFWDLEDLLQQ
jgi:WD40 repeat protein